MTVIRKNIDDHWEFVEGKLSMLPGYKQPGKIVNLCPMTLPLRPIPPGGTWSQLTGYYGEAEGHIPKYWTFLKSIPGNGCWWFDGVYMNATVELNGHMVTRHHYGYTPFHADLTSYMKPGKKNRLR